MQLIVNYSFRAALCYNMLRIGTPQKSDVHRIIHLARLVFWKYRNHIIYQQFEFVQNIPFDYSSQGIRW